MPKFKEVVSLQTMALDLFIESVIQCCDRLSKAKNRDLYRSGVIAIRTEVHRYLPGTLLAEFGNRFFENFELQSYDKLDYQVGLEMIMDIKIVGLRLRGKNLRYVDLRDGQRFPGLGELDLSGTKHTSYTESWRSGWNLIGEEIYRYLPTFNTNFLTKFVHYVCCDDDALAIIGRLCQNLEVLQITGSGHVTDEGLRALSPCSNLRCVHFRRCPKVSHVGLNHILSAHNKLEDFYYEPHDDVSSGLDLSVTVPSLKSLIIRISRRSLPALNLSFIVRKFPNLINLGINCPNVSNLSVLKHMNELTGLKIYFRDGICTEKLQQTWDDIEEILAFIGPKITTLMLWAYAKEFSCRQEQLNMIYDRCPNLERLVFDHPDGILMVPEFKKLKALAPRSCLKSVWSLNFGTMLNLEILRLPYSEETIDFKTIPEMMSSKKFPKLSVLKMIPCFHDSNYMRYQSIVHSEEVERIVKADNLDFRVVEDYNAEPLRCEHSDSDHSTSDHSDDDFSDYSDSDF